MSDLGRETRVKALGKTWTLGRITIGLIEEFAAWVREQEGDPFAFAERFIDKMTPEDARIALAEAKANAEALKNFSIASPLGHKWLKSERGAAKIAYLMLRDNHPDIDEETAFAVFQELGAGILAKQLRDGSGSVPNASAPAE